MLKVEHLSTVYKHKKGIIDSSFTIEDGKIIGIYGSTGSGKTTLMKSILQLLPKTTGIVEWKEKNIRECLVDIAYVSQYPCSVTSMEPFSYGQFLTQFYPNFKLDQFQRMLTEFKVPPHIKIMKLSTEQQSMVELASAFSQGASLLLLDEAFQYFPRATKEADITRLFTYLQGNETILLTTSTLQDIENIVDTIIYLKNGVQVDKADIEIEETSIQEHIEEKTSIPQESKKEYHFTMNNDEMFEESGDDDESM